MSLVTEIEHQEDLSDQLPENATVETPISDLAPSHNAEQSLPASTVDESNPPAKGVTGRKQLSEEQLVFQRLRWFWKSGCYPPLWRPSSMEPDQLVFRFENADFLVIVKTGVHPKYAVFSGPTGAISVFSKKQQVVITTLGLHFFTADLTGVHSSSLQQQILRKLDTLPLMLSENHLCDDCKLKMDLIIPKNPDRKPFWAHRGKNPECKTSHSFGGRPIPREVRTVTLVREPNHSRSPRRA